MSEIIVDFIGNEMPPGVLPFVGMEWASTGASCSIVSSPAPYASDVESGVFKITQDSGSDKNAIGRTSAFSIGDVYLAQGPFRFDSEGGWPNTGNVDILSLHNTVGFHITLRLIDNGSAGGTVPDLEILDSAGATKATIVNPFPDLSTWYWLRLLTKLSNNGDCLLQIWTAPGLGITAELLSETAVTGEDFRADAFDLVGLRVEGEGGTTPLERTTLYMSSLLLSKSSQATPFSSSSFTLGHVCVAGARPTKDSLEPDCDATGAAGGDTLDGSDKWIKVGDGLVGRGGAEYRDDGDTGAVAVDSPAGDSRITALNVQLAASWMYLLNTTISGDAEIIYGRTDDSGSGFSVTLFTPAIPGINRPFKVVEDINEGSNVIPAIGKKGVIGFANRSVGPRTVYLPEAAYFGLYEYPLRVRQVTNGEVCAGGIGRIVL